MPTTAAALPSAGAMAVEAKDAVGAAGPGQGCYICAAITEATVEDAVAQMSAAKDAGATLVELRIDHLEGSVSAEVGSSDAAIPAIAMIERLLAARPLPAIVTLRPTWEGGRYDGDEGARLRVLERAMELGAEFVDVELKAAAAFAARPAVAALRAKDGRPTRLILSHHDYEATPSDDELAELIGRMVAGGCDVAKIASFAVDISDSMRVLRALAAAPVPAILISMGPRGQATRLLAPKFGAVLTFGALAAGKESAPGQSTVGELCRVYALSRQGAATTVLGLIGNPVSHSKGPVLHNAAMRDRDFDGVYVPFLVDDVPRFLAALPSPDFAGFSVTIPHKEVALQCCAEVDPLAAAIGAVNTLVRRGDGTFKGYNTDCSAAISAIEDGLRQHAAKTGLSAAGRDATASPLEGKTVVVLGAGGAGRAVAFGAAQKGARVLIANRRHERAVELAAAVGASSEAVEIARLADGSVGGDVLANTTSVGMHPNVDESPLPAVAVAAYAVVFDAVYNPLETRLLKDAAAAGAVVVSGVEMFVGQAADQFELFTGQRAPRKLMMDVVMGSLAPK